MSSLAKVVITDFITEPLHYERSVLDGHAEVTALDVMSEDDLLGNVEDADALMVYHYLSSLPYSSQAYSVIERSEMP